MGQQSILEVNKDTYREYFESELLTMVKQNYIESKFKVGLKADKYKLAYNLFMVEILDKCNCEIDNYIWQKINGVLDVAPQIDLKTGKSIYVAQSVTNINNTTNITNPAYQWSSIAY